MPNPTRTIVVFESRLRWVPELQRQFRDQAVRVRGCRTWSELSEYASDVDVVIIDLPEDLTESLRWLSSLVTEFKASPVIALCPSEVAVLEWTLRDVGAKEVFVGNLSGDQLARSCRQLLSI